MEHPVSKPPHALSPTHLPPAILRGSTTRRGLFALGVGVAAATYVTPVTATAASRTSLTRSLLTRRPATGRARLRLDSFRTDGSPRGNARQLQLALDQLRARGGGTLLIPNRRILVQPSGTFDLPPATALIGAGAKAELALHVSDTTRYVQLLRIRSGRVRLENLRLTRANGAYGRMITIAGGSGIWLNNVRINTYASRWRNDFSAIDLVNTSPDPVRGMTLVNCDVVDTQYGLLSSNTRTGLVDDVLVTGCRFVNNRADDLEFNSPHGTMSRINVVGNNFASNRNTGPSAGFAVGMAHVTGGSIAGNTFSGYAMNPVHLEDRTNRVVISNNHFSAASHRHTGFAAHLIVLSGCFDLTVKGNVFDTSRQQNTIDCVFLGPGGPRAPRPRNVTTTGNTYRLANKSRRLGDYGADRVSSSAERTVHVR